MSQRYQKSKSKTFKSQNQIQFKKPKSFKNDIQKIYTQRKISLHFLQKNKNEQTNDKKDNIKKIKIIKSHSTHCQLLLNKLKNQKQNRYLKQRDQNELIFKSSKKIQNKVQTSLKVINTQRKIKFTKGKNNFINDHISTSKKYQTVKYQTSKQKNPNQFQQIVLQNNRQLKQKTLDHKQNFEQINLKKKHQRFISLLRQINKIKYWQKSQEKHHKVISPCKFVVNPFSKIKNRKIQLSSRKLPDKVQENPTKGAQSQNISICFQNLQNDQISEIRQNDSSSNPIIDFQSLQCLEILNF